MMTWALPLDERISRTCKILFAIEILYCNFAPVYFYFYFFFSTTGIDLYLVEENSFFVCLFVCFLILFYF